MTLRSVTVVTALIKSYRVLNHVSVMVSGAFWMGSGVHVRFWYTGFMCLKRQENLTKAQKCGYYEYKKLSHLKAEAKQQYQTIFFSQFWTYFNIFHLVLVCIPKRCIEKSEVQKKVSLNIKVHLQLLFSALPFFN